MNTLTIEQFQQATGESGALQVNYPGSTATAATVRYMACLCAAYCAHNEVDFETDISGLLSGIGIEYHMLGQAFAACTDRNLGNKYASVIISKTLQSFSGESVSQEIGELLQLLEQFLIASGDVRKSEEGDT